MSLSCEHETALYRLAAELHYHHSKNIREALLCLLTIPLTVEDLKESIYYIKKEITNRNKREKELHNEKECRT